MPNLILNPEFNLYERNGKAFCSSRQVADEEEWLPLKGTDGRYNISNYGQVMNNRTGLILKPQPFFGSGEHKYLGVGIYYNGVKRAHRIHREVAKHFISNPFSLPEVNHKDGNKNNNHYKNLEWCTPSYNNKHAYAIGLKTPIRVNGANNGMAKLNEIQVKDIRKKYLAGVSAVELAKKYLISYKTVNAIINRRRWGHIA